MSYSYMYSRTKVELSSAGKLFNALLEENEDAIALELEHGANPNLLLPEEGITPFHYVVGGAEDKQDLTALFLCYHANPNVRSSEGLTPLHVAATWGREESVRLLLQNGASPNAQDENGQTALEMAFEKGHLNIISIIQASAVCDEKEEESELPKYVKQLRCIIDSEALPRCSNSEKLTQDMIDEVTHGVGNLMRDSSFDSDTDNSLVRPANNGKQRADDWSRSNCSLSKDKYLPQGIGEGFMKASFESDDSGAENHSYDNISSEDNHLCVYKSSGDDHLCINRSGKEDNLCVNSSREDDHLCVNRSRAEDHLCVNRSRADGDGACTCSLNVTQELQKLLEDIEGQGADPNGTAELEQILHNLTFSKHRIDVTSPDHPCVQVKSDLDMASDLDATIATSSSGSYHSCEEGVQNGNELEDMHTNAGGVDTRVNMTLVHSKLNETFTLDSEGNIIDAQFEGVQEDKPNELVLLRDKIMPPPSASCIPSITFSTVPRVVTEKNPFTKVNRHGSPLSGQFDDADSLLSEDISLLSSDHSSGHSSLSDSTIIYEYQYTDIEDGHELIERHFVSRSVTPSPDTTVCCCNSYDSAPSVASSLPSVASSVRRLDNLQVREMLQNLGDVPGPVTESTRLVYLRRLTHLRKDPSAPRRVVKPTCSGYSQQLSTILQGSDDLSVKDFTAIDEQEMSSSFSDPTRTWREGSLKASFNYLLLDSSVTQNLPMATNLTEHEKFKIFISAVLYIGKGKRSRPYCHFYEALDSRKKGCTGNGKVSNKVERILDIWNQGLGVVSLHVYQNVLPVEAYTREAAMIDAMGMANLTNIQKGNYYGVASTWTPNKKRDLGTFLLLKAFHIFMLEGERQIRPGDIKTGE
ncbi:uncharacterized protein LOC135482788 [Lineus longissimus]|uniref:uncharacterized protein LOC135482788 n=1 Tax=Lineus longissimus TaxID=88925 RepID=UPI002B4DAEB2